MKGKLYHFCFIFLRDDKQNDLLKIMFYKCKAQHKMEHNLLL